MTSDREAWHVVERLLDAALDLPPNEQSAFLERECDDDALRSRLRVLLSAAAASGSFLERPAQEVASALVAEAVAERAAEQRHALPTERIGPYRLVGEVGRGGMGAVYLAERDDEEFHRRAAIKLVHSAAAPGLNARFLAERQILASLDHPNIARLYDGGTTDGGTSYLVMEYIDGRRVDAYCDEKALSVDQRLALFETVCDAVQFAHQNMVVHRDLKPSNVLVTEDGAVKLLDFGVAKLLDPLRPAADLTQTAFVPMTPAYASPEQLRGEPISTATDVYALGVLLHELVAGVGPYDVTGRTPSEIEQLVAEREPLRPSSVVRSSQEAAAIASLRATTPKGLSRRLRGDLDNIVLTALRKEVRNRYRSVYHLRDDVRRERDGLPVSARAPTFGYLAGKFVRRNRVGVAAAGLVLLSLVAGLAGTAWQARAAEREARRATEVRDFVVGLFESSDPDSTKGRTVTVLELLDRGAARLDSGLTGEPALRSDMLGVVGRMYLELGQYDRARRLLEEALTVRRGLGRAVMATDIAESAADLAAVLREQAEYDVAESLSREALAVRRGRADSEPAALSSSLGDLASIMSLRGDADGADSLYREALAIDGRLDDSEALATHLDQYGIALWRAARYEESQRVLEDALAMRRMLYGRQHTLVATTLLNLSTTVIESGDYARAEALVGECLEIRRTLLGEAHPHVASALNNLGSVFVRAGRLEEAETTHRQALEIYRSAFGDAHPEVANSMNQLGVVLYYTGRHSEAAKEFERVLELWRASYGTHHRNVLAVLNNLGAARREGGDLAGAEDALRTTLQLRREALGDPHADIAQSLNNLGLLLVQRGDLTEADSMFRQAIDIWRRTLGDENPAVADGLMSLGRLRLQESRFAEAAAVLREAVHIRTTSLAAEAPLLASARLNLAESLIPLGRLGTADSLLGLALPVLTRQWGENAELTDRARRAAAEIRAPRSP
jgi:serine/threonine-protein kinase